MVTCLPLHSLLTDIQRALNKRNDCSYQSISHKGWDWHK